MRKRSLYIDEELKVHIKDFLSYLDFIKDETDICNQPEIFQRISLARSLLNDSLKFFG